MGTKQRRAQERQLRLNQILDAARQLLFTDGIDKVSMNKIAKRAELGVGTIYFYFKSKEEIFVALQKEGLSLFYEEISAIHVSEVSAAEKLQQIAQTYYLFSRDHKDYLDIINMFLASSKEFLGPDLKSKVDMSGSKIFDLIEQIILEGMQAGTFNNIDAKNCAIMFFGALHGIMQFKKLEKTALAGKNHRDVFDFTVDRLIQGIAIETKN